MNRIDLRIVISKLHNQMDPGEYGIWLITNLHGRRDELIDGKMGQNMVELGVLNSKYAYNHRDYIESAIVGVI